MVFIIIFQSSVSIHFYISTGRDYLCVQSLDAQLSFFEQDAYAFTRPLPNSLLPSPICYLAKTDSFIVQNSQFELECYKYGGWKSKVILYHVSIHVHTLYTTSLFMFTSFKYHVSIHFHTLYILVSIHVHTF